VRQIADRRADGGEVGQSTELAAFVAANGQPLLRFAFLLTGGDAPAAEDLLYSVLGRLVERGTESLDDPLVYVRRCLVNEQRSQGRRARRHQASIQLLAADRDSVPAPAPEDRLVIIDALRALGARERAAILLRYYDDLPDEQIAAILGCSRATVRSLVHRAMPKLRTRLTEPGEAARGLEVEP
jgi:RNA polymerase sigma factor (sigma-70 family)